MNIEVITNVQYLVWSMRDIIQIKQMNWQLESFYHSSSPQRILDQQIKPIVQHLKILNINSLYQLRTKLHEISSNQGITQFSKTLPVFGHPTNKIQNGQSNVLKGQKQIVKPLIYSKRSSFTLSPHPKPYEESNEKERVFSISPISKVKKHLVEGVNLQDMKQALFKKRKTLNRFQQFCQNVKAKDRSQQGNKLSVNRRKPNSSLPSQQKGESASNDTFRITTRRKFWRTSRTSQFGEQPSQQILSIRSIGMVIGK